MQSALILLTLTISCNGEKKEETALHECLRRHALSCNLAKRMIEPFRVNKLNWKMLRDHNGIFLVIDHNRAKFLRFFRSTNFTSDTLGWFTKQDEDRINIIMTEESLPSIILPLNIDDSSVSNSKYLNYPVISFCQKDQNIDILWPSSQDYSYNTRDYKVTRRRWLSKLNKAWFRGDG